MCEILFRGKTDKGEWVIGSLIQVENYCCILSEDSREDYDYPYLDGYLGTIDGQATPIQPETIGQYTGLTDKNGNKIFEGDIVKGKDALEKDLEVYGYIDYKNGSFVIVGDFMTHYRWLDYEVEVIGNIHDNPELLKGGAE